MSRAATSRPSAWARSAAACSRPPTTSRPRRPWRCSVTRPGRPSTASDPGVVGATFVIEGHPFTVVGVTPPGFFGETLRREPPDLWIPLQQEPLIDGEGALLNQPVSAWLRVIGRLKPGASTAGMAPRLTSLLRSWIQFDSGYPANWMPEIIRLLPKQTLAVVPAGAGVAVLKEEYGRSLQILLARVRPRAADCLRQRREPAAGASRRPPRTNGLAAGAWRAAAGNRRAGAGREHAAGGGWRARRPGGGRRRGPAAPRARLSQRSRAADQRPALAGHAGVRVWRGARHRRRLRRRARLVRDAHASDRRAAPAGPDRGRPRRWPARVS